MVFETITNDNWLSYAMKHYDNPTLEKDVEFNDDLKRFKYLKRLFRKYELTGNMKVRLAVNHIVVLHNVFNTYCATTLLLFKIDRVYWPILKSVMRYLNYLYPDELDDINDDGISHVKEGGLKLEVKHERISNGTFKVYAKLI